MAKSKKPRKSASKKTKKKKPAKTVKKKRTTAISAKKAVRKKTRKKLTKPARKKESMVKRKTRKTAAKKVTVKKVAAKKKTTKKRIPARKTTVRKPKVLSKAKVTKVAKQVVELPKPKLEDIKGYSKKDLEHFKEIILEKRDEIIEQLQNLKDQMLDPTTGEYINENSPYSLHMAEQGTDAMEREKTFLYAQRENKFLGYLEDALKRIEAGTYGICIECIEEPQYLCETCPLVPKARLEAVPHSQLCLPMKQKKERR
jgi:DnaK suppressor protein